ncbi:hypothetical protein D3C73_1457650 [compost metagenome]
MLPRADGMTEPSIVRDGEQEVSVRAEVVAHLLTEHNFVADSRRQVITAHVQLWLDVIATAEG